MDYRKILMGTIVELMQENDFDDITVQMILDRSSISRSTFYRYFRDKYDLVDSYYVDTVRQFWGEEDTTDWKIYLTQVFRFLKDHATYFRKAYRITGDNSFWNGITNYSVLTVTEGYRRIHNKAELDVVEKYKISAYVNSQIYLSRLWLDDGCPISCEDMAELVCSLTPKEYLEGVSILNQKNVSLLLGK